jgi:pyruvate formate lyase activating enzyme
MASRSLRFEIPWDSWWLRSVEQTRSAPSAELWSAAAIPGFNDSAEEIRDTAQFLRSVSPDIPWHVTAFHPDYKMTDRAPTPARTLVRAAELGRTEGLRYVYAGNSPGAVGPFENTWCPSCGALLVERVGYRILQNRITPSCGSCPECSTTIPGVWSREARGSSETMH